MVIGKKGKNIKIIRKSKFNVPFFMFYFSEETSGANVYIDKEYNGSDSNAMCVIQGKLEQVSIAKVMIQEKLNQYNSANTFPIQHDNEGRIWRWNFSLYFLGFKMDDNGLGSPQSSSGSSQPSFLPSPVQTSNPLMNRKGIITSLMMSFAIT